MPRTGDLLQILFVFEQFRVQFMTPDSTNIVQEFALHRFVNINSVYSRTLLQKLQGRAI